MKRTVFAVAIGLIHLLASGAAAYHPLITDDTGTQGAGKYQLEANLEYARNDDLGVTENKTQAAATLTYGIVDNLDIAVSFPWLAREIKEAGESSSESGISDLSISAKWRFHEQEGFSLALRSGITLPTGNDDKGLGSGRMTYGLFFIATKEWKPYIFHMNLGYKRNENRRDERLNLWHVSLAGEFEATESLRVALNIGQERNPDRSAGKDPAFVLAGLVYSVTKYFDLDFGLKRALNNAEPDYTIMGGVTLRF